MLVKYNDNLYLNLTKKEIDKIKEIKKSYHKRSGYRRPFFEGTIIEKNQTIYI